MEPIRFERSHTYPIAVEAAFDDFLALPITDVFSRQHGPLPPIKEVRGSGPTFDAVGDTRILVLRGGGNMRETLTTVERPDRFVYEITEITGPLKPLVSTVDGTWAFAAEDDGTRISWTWELHPRSGLGARVLPLLGRFWQGYARKAFENLETLLPR